MERFITSDLHLGHALVAKQRGFATTEEHDEAVIESMMSLPKRSKLWVLGDIAWNVQCLEYLWDVPSQVKVAILGNHDSLHAKNYLSVFDDIHGALKYKNIWMTHIPIHPQELHLGLGNLGNIHGHIHKDTISPELERPYFNANWDFHRGPILFDIIETELTRWCELYAD